MYLTKLENLKRRQVLEKEEKRLKRFSLSISVAFVILIGLTGCGDNDQNNAIGANNYQEGQEESSNQRGFMNRSNNVGDSGTAQGQRRNINEYDDELVSQIVDQVEEVEGVYDAYVLLQDKDVIIAVETLRNINEIRWEVEQYTNNLTSGRNVIVVSDEEVVGQVRVLDYDRRRGKTFDDNDPNFQEIIDDIDRAVRDSLDRNTEIQ